MLVLEGLWDWWQRTGFPAGTVAPGEVAARDHELLDDAVEAGALISEALFTCAESAGYHNIHTLAIISSPTNPSLAGMSLLNHERTESSPQSTDTC